MGTPPGWRLEHRASNPVSVKNLTAIETSTSVKLLRPCVPVGTKRTIERKRRRILIFRATYMKECKHHTFFPELIVQKTRL
jgi:hypothetical protein